MTSCPQQFTKHAQPAVAENTGSKGARALVPDFFRLELFSREERPGWDVMGNQVGVFA